jgi:hypothetical protein
MSKPEKMKLKSVTRALFVSLLVLALSCGDEEKTDYSAWAVQKPEHPQENYWNNYLITQKVLESCKGIYFPDYFPISPGYTKIIRKIIPGDTIIYFAIEMEKFSLPGKEQIFYFLDKKSKLFFDPAPQYDIPFLTGIFSCDSSQHLLYQGLRDLGTVRNPEALRNSREIFTERAFSPCIGDSSGANGNTTFMITKRAELDTIRFNHTGAEIDPMALKQYSSKYANRGGIKLSIPAAMVPVEEHPCIKISIYYSPKDTARNKGLPKENFVVWFERTIGAVKILSVKDGVTYLLGRRND